MFKYLKVINQSNKTVKYTYITIKTWQTGILDTAPSQKAGQQKEGPTPAPSPPPALPTSGSDPLCALRNLLLTQEHPQPSSSSLGHPFPTHKQLYLDHLLGWDMGTGKEACSGAGNRDARVQVLRARPLEGRSSRWLHPLVLSGCLHLVVGVGMGGVWSATTGWPEQGL